MKGKKNRRICPGEYETGETKKVSSTTVFAVSESHKVVNYLMQTKWNISQCQNLFFTFMCKFLQRSTC